MSEFGTVLKKQFPDYPVATVSMPYFVLRLLALIDGRLTPELLAEAGNVSHVLLLLVMLIFPVIRCLLRMPETR